MLLLSGVTSCVMVCEQVYMTHMKLLNPTVVELSGVTSCDLVCDLVYVTHMKLLKPTAPWYSRALRAEWSLALPGTRPAQ
jgi:hypothetical protein